MKIIYLAGCVVAVALLLPACGKQQGPPSVAPAVQGGQTQAVADTGASLIIEPGSVSACDPQTPIVSHVSWKFNKASVEQVKVMVTDPGLVEARLFSAGGDEGDADTGNWVISGMRFDLVNADTGAKLATYTVSALPCTTGQ